jgi:DNA polymerase-3 subunit alpha
MFLNCHSWFSFYHGTLSIENLLTEAQRFGVKKLVLTDINNTSGVLDFIRLAPKYDVEPAVGVEFRNGNDLKFIAIASNNEGFEEINRFLSSCLKFSATEAESSGNRDAIVPDDAPAFRNAWVIYPFNRSQTGTPPPALPTEQIGLRIQMGTTMKNTVSKAISSSKKKKLAAAASTLRENEFIGVRPSEINKLALSPWAGSLSKCVVLWPVTVRHKTDHNVHRILAAVGQNKLLSMVPPEVFCDPTETLVNTSDIHQRYEQFPQLIKNTERLLQQCHIAFDFHVSKNKKVFTGSTIVDRELLHRETWKGVQYRYGENPSDTVKERIRKELQMIGDLGFSSYFLINWDIVRYAQSKGYFYVGRGSGANSMVAYCLRITDVDPNELDLYFERFINPYRQNPPDFDLDFSWKDRDDITRYIFRRHGNEHVALLGTYTTFQSNAVIRELGKVFGLPKADIDALQSTKDIGIAGDGLGKIILKYSALLQDFPHHLSVHAGGIIISERPVVCYTALNHPPKGFPLTQFSMLEAEDVGHYKFDILSQRGLGHIRDAVDIVKQNRDIDIDIHQVKEFKEDPKIRALIRDGRCMGCFYVESPAMRMLLKKLRVEQYIALVAASSIIRPGVARSGMMREYILRTHDPAKRIYAHPVMKTLMEETFGIMVYQEDVIKVAHHFAGLDLSEADVLRRGMSGKFRSREEFLKIKDRFFSNCKEKGYEEEITGEVWRQIESFAGYSFSKGHSASYAVESYQSLFLKAHYPLEFMVGVINNFGGFYNTEFYVHEARMSGATIHPPDVNKSQYLTSIIGSDIYLGFVHMEGLEYSVATLIPEEREANGPYHSLEEFMKRISISLDGLRILIRIGAFQFTGRSKKELLWDIHLHMETGKKTEVKQELFPVENPDYTLPPLHHHRLEDAFDEIEILGFALRSPFELLKRNFAKQNAVIETPTSTAKANTTETILVKDMPQLIGKSVELIGYLVTVKPTRTIRGDRMAFGCFIDEQGYFFDTTHFPPVINAYPFRGRGCYSVKGRVDEEFGFCSITVTAMEKLTTIGMEDLS